MKQSTPSIFYNYPKLSEACLKYLILYNISIVVMDFLSYINKSELAQILFANTY